MLAIAIFVNGAKGVSALQLSRDLNVQYKTAFVLAHKLRETMAAERRWRRRPASPIAILSEELQGFGMVPPGELCSHRRRSLQEGSLVLGNRLLENGANLRL